MKEFACGLVIPGCPATFEGATPDDVLSAVAVHAREAHAIDPVPADVVAQVRDLISERS